ncbi:MAG: outer membrane protein [Daejeonella sp.]|nr:outer membrane protein [Daejeonella sp.]
MKSQTRCPGYDLSYLENTEYPIPIKMKKGDIAHITSWLLLLLLVIASKLADAQTIQSIDVKDALQLARAQNRQLQADSLNIDRAKQQTNITKGRLLPYVEFGGQIDHFFQKPVFFGLGGTDNPSKGSIGYGRFGGEDQAQASLSLLQPLYNAVAYPELKKNKLQEEQSHQRYKYSEVDLTAQVKQTYLRILVLEKRLNLQKESIARNKKALEDSRSLLVQGRALRVDTLRAYTSLKNLEPDVLRLEDAIEVSKQQLNILMGVDPSLAINLKDSLVYNPSDLIPTEANAYNLSLAQRQDLKVLELNQDISKQQITSAAAARLPSVNFVSQYQVQTQTNNFKYGNANYPPVFYVGAQLSIPLFTGFTNTAKIRQAKIEHHQNNLVYQNARELLKTEVKQVVSALNETSKRIQTQQNVSETAAQSYAMTKYRYERGVASRLELIDAELALTTASSNYLEAVYNYQSAKIELDRTLGRNGE